MPVGKIKLFEGNWSPSAEFRVRSILSHPYYHKYEILIFPCKNRMLLMLKGRERSWEKSSKEPQTCMSSLLSHHCVVVHRPWFLQFENFFSWRSLPGSLHGWAAGSNLLFNGRGGSCEGDAWLNHTSRQAQLPEMSVSIIIRLWSEASCSLAMLEGPQRTLKGKYNPHKKRTSSLRGWGVYPQMLEVPSWDSDKLGRVLRFNPHKRTRAPGKKPGCRNQRIFHSVWYSPKHSWLSCSSLK